MQTNWLDIAILIVLAIGVVKGLLDGIIRQVVSLIALLLAIFLSGSVATWIRDFVSAHLEIGDLISPLILNALWYILAFLAIFFLLVSLGNLLSKAVNYTPAGAVDKLFGAISGAFFWILSLSILLNILAVFSPTSTLIPEQIRKESVLYDRTRALFPTLYPYIKEYIQKSNV